MPRPLLEPDRGRRRARTSRRTRPRRSACRGSRACRSPRPSIVPPRPSENWKWWPGRRWLVDDEHREAAVAGRTVGVGAGEHHEGVGATRERAPGLHAVEQVAAVGRGRGGLDARDVGAVVGLGHHHADDALAARDRGEPPLLLLLGPALHDRAGEDLGPGDERAAGAERAPRQLLGRDDHREVVGLAAGGEALVLLGHREPEAADLGEAADDLLGDVGVLAVDVLRDGSDLVLGEAVERVAHHVELVVEVRGAGAGRGDAVGEAGEEPRVAEAADELGARARARRARRPSSRSRPRSRPPRSADRVGDERERERLLELAGGAVVEHHPASPRPRSRRGRGRTRRPGARRASRPRSGRRRGCARRACGRPGRRSARRRRSRRPRR